MAFSTNSVWILLFIYFAIYSHVSDMKTAEQIINNLINENIFPLKVSSLLNKIGDI